MFIEYEYNDYSLYRMYGTYARLYVFNIIIVDSCAHKSFNFELYCKNRGLNLMEKYYNGNGSSQQHNAATVAYDMYEYYIYIELLLPLRLCRCCHCSWHTMSDLTNIY